MLKRVVGLATLVSVATGDATVDALGQTADGA